MTKTPTEDVEKTLAQIERLVAAGAKIVRLAVPDKVAVRAFADIRRRVCVPLAADIHFDHRLALGAIEAGADKVRLNPGNLRNPEKFALVVQAAAKAGVAIRIGLNSGSVRRRGKGEGATEDARQDVVELMVERALEAVRLSESLGFHALVLSLKASDVPATLAAYRRVAPLTDYPLHLGVTATGPGEPAVVRSAIGIGTLLAEGIGDTLRVSLTGPPEREVEVGYQILEALGLGGLGGPHIISCPTCGRTRFDLLATVEEVRQRLKDSKKNITVAIMGCVVNGPGEATEANIGIAGAKGYGILFQKGRRPRRVPGPKLVEELLKEIDRL
jgi:(E)-4-hydroxy-3-methylbut-2-enyl-diphosphate synthase